MFTDSTSKRSRRHSESVSIEPAPAEVGSLPNVESAINHGVGGGDSGVGCIQLASLCLESFNLTVPLKAFPGNPGVVQFSAKELLLCPPCQLCVHAFGNHRLIS